MALRRVSLVQEAEERLAVQGADKSISEAEEHIKFFTQALLNKKSEYESGLLSRSVAETSALKTDIESIEDILKENKRILAERQAEKDAAEWKRAHRLQLDVARKELKVLEEEKDQVGAEISRLRAMVVSLPAEIAQLEWKWNQCLWQLSRKSDELKSLEGQ